MLSAIMEADEALVRQVAARDGVAVEKLYEIVREIARPVAMRRLPGKDPGDLVHEVLAAVVEAIRGNTLRNPGALRSYIRAVAERQSATGISQEMRDRLRRVDTEAALHHRDKRESPESALILHERAALLSLLLQQLRSREMELLTRFYLREQAHQQICEEMHLTETQFRLCKSRAKAKLSALAARPQLVRALEHQAVGRSGAGI